MVIVMSGGYRTLFTMFENMMIITEESSMASLSDILFGRGAVEGVVPLAEVPHRAVIIHQVWVALEHLRHVHSARLASNVQRVLTTGVSFLILIQLRSNQFRMLQGDNGEIIAQQ